MTVWSDEALEEFKTLWADPNLSATMISRRMCHKFGPSFTRNAILGKRHRMGLAQRAKKSDGAVKFKRKGAERPRAMFYRPKPKIAMPRIIRDDQIPRSQRKSIWDLAPCDCRWPVGEVGEPGFFFCGAPAMDWSPYCVGHHARAHREPEQQRKAA